MAGSVSTAGPGQYASGETEYGMVPRTGPTAVGTAGLYLWHGLGRTLPAAGYSGGFSVPSGV